MYMSNMSINTTKIIGTLQVTLIAFAFLGTAFVLSPTTAFAADWGQNIANKINDIYTQLQPIVISLATLGIAFGAIQWATSGGNVDKKSMGKKILFGAAISIALYFSAGAFVNWAKDNLKIDF
jgi:ribose/xylose/arabinose/galactoside ABC-type transport system permease subunit